MKSLRQLSIVPSALALAAAAFFTPASNAGLISLLKGEKADPVPESQRVAFIGCAEVKEVKGRVEALGGIDQWLPLQPGAHLHEGDVVRTQGGEVVLKMCESSSLVRVTSQTILRLLPLNEGWDRSALSGTEEKPGYVVRSLRGNALYQHESAQWKPVVVNEVLPEGAVIKTAPGTKLQMFSTDLKRTVSVDSASIVTLQTSLVQKSLDAKPALAALVRP